MISYTEEVRNGLAPSAWREAGLRPTDTLLAIGSEFNDQVHISGPVDYFIRFLVNVTDIVEQEKGRNFFHVLVSNKGIDTVIKVGDEKPFSGGALTFQQPWEDEIYNRFRTFRRRLG
jgi:hypothetical protein